MTFNVVPLVMGYDILCHMSRRFWKLFELLPPPYFAKLNFSEVVHIWILFRTSLPPYRIDYCCIGGMTGVYFLVYSPMVRMTSLPTDMNGLWIDRWYMRQDWIRPALAAAAITSLFYAENCKKSNPLPCCRLMGRAFRAELRVSFTVKKRKKYRL